MHIMTKPVILTGLRANNDLHIGNYFGGLRPMIDMAKNHADEYTINLFIPDLHSFTTPIDHSTLYDTVIANARIYAAAGLPLDHPSIHMYRQSRVPAHSELAWILDCFTGMGEMGRMTQYKDKSAKLGDEQITVGLFNYPVLMAADILLYNTQYIPVGEDQTQHLEFTRDIAERMNNRFGDVFTVPAPVREQNKFFGHAEGIRIKDLVDPSKKMSKSDETGKGVIFLNDTPEAARKKIMSATTDNVGRVNYDKVNQPGISNLIEILALLRGQTPEEVAAKYKGLELYGNFKKVVADEVVAFLTEFQRNLETISEAQIITKLEQSEYDVTGTANETLYRVQKAVGLRK